MDIDELLDKYQAGVITKEEVKACLQKLPYEDLSFAKLDHHRKLRTGYGEVVFCSGKVTEHLVKIYEAFAADGVDVLGSRASREQYEAVREAFKGRIADAQGEHHASLDYDEISRTLIYRQNVEEKQSEGIGNICVCSGGTADIPVAEEAAKVAEFFGNKVTRVYDVGVAGIHRLLSNIDEIGKANCIVAVAGMEGALPGVIAGLVSVPVIGVPTSVGYGTGYQGAAAVLTMLNSCANGIATVNIDNGFGAAYIASQINHQTVS